MELIIKNEVEDTSLKDVFVIEVTMMHGDADGYTKGEIMIPKEKEELVKDAIRTLENMLSLPWNEARHGYARLPEFLAWFGYEYLGDYDDEPWDEKYTLELWEEISEYSFEWDKDHTNIDIYTRCDGYEIYYYDENGLQHEVEVKL